MGGVNDNNNNKWLTSYYIIITVKPLLKDTTKLWKFFGKN